MPNFDIEKYIAGKMSGAEKKALEAEMNRNPDFAQEVNIAQQLAEDIDVQSMRNEVRAIMKNKPKSGGHSSSPWLSLLALLTVICIGAFLFIGDDEKEVPSIEAAPPVESQSTPPKKESWPEPPFENNEENPEIKEKPQKETPTKEKKERKKNRPIAENNEAVNIAPPLFPSPKLRGQNEGNEAWQKLLDQVWYTKFPPADATFSEPYMEAAELLKQREFTKAFTKLEILGFSVSENDTLSYLKGYCLTEMGEGKDAIRYFDSLKNTPENWKAYVEWHRALSVLNSEGIETALPYFKEIEKSENHIFQKESTHTIKLLEDSL